MSLTIQRLKELISYDPATGDLTRLVPRGRSPKGALCGTLRQNGYLQTSVDGVLYLNHRLIWFYMTGAWPKDEVDHENNVGSDNRWVNLREATRQQNAANKPAYNREGLKGVYRRPGRNAYDAQISIGRKRKYLGSFATPQEAHAAYVEAAKAAFGDFAKAA